MIAAERTVCEIPLKSAAVRITLPQSALCDIAEIRLRAGRSAVAVRTDGEMLRCSAPFTREDITECFLELCRSSIHSFSHEIAEGYITLAGGHRVGFCGTAVLNDGKLSSVHDITSLNIRFAREVKGCARELFGRAFSGGICSLILAGKPLSGKTTVLRDLARILGERRRVCVIDSRMELAGGCVPLLDAGENTDVLSGYPKGEGIMCALRALSPDVIICDEIGDDAEEVRQCANCGVKLVVSAHAASIAELKSRPNIAPLLPYFDKAAVLSGFGKLSELEDLQQ